MAQEARNQLRESVKVKRTIPGTPAYAHELELLPKATSRTVNVTQAAVVLRTTRPTLYGWEDRGLMPPRVRRRGRKEWHLSDIVKLAIHMNIKPLLPDN